MSATPLVRKFKKGSLVTFQSTGEDMTFTFNNSNASKFKFSKFALLEIPPIQNQTNGQNNIQFKNIEGTFIKGLSTDSPAPEGDRTDLSESLQNYLLNMETLLIRSDEYDATQKLNTAERIFWKWMKEIGAMRYREASVSEKASTIVDQKFVETDNNDLPSAGDLYKKVVKYIGEIDMDGSHRTNTNSFKEVYIYVPVQNGSTPVVMFDSIEDSNYFAGQTIRKVVSDPNLEFIAGRDASDDPTSAGLSVTAAYDMDVPSGSVTYNVNGGADAIWFTPTAPNGPNAYFTDPTFGDTTTDVIIRTNPSTTEVLEYRRSRLDGVVIDWDQSDYKYFEDNPEATAFNEYNSVDSARPFRYNAIAIYYDIYDPNNLDDDGNPIDIATNLHSVLFLNDLEVISGGASQIGYDTKLKPNSVTGEIGNGYGTKLNFKFDVSSDTISSTEVEITVDPYNTFSMELFSDTMQRIALSNANLEKVVRDNTALAQSISALEQLILSDANAQSLQTQINEINALLDGVQSSSDILDLISKNTDSINEILAGNTTVGLDFFLDLRADDGLRLELVNNVLTFKNNRQKYDVGSEININTSINQLIGVYNVLPLKNHTTLYWHKNNGIDKQAQDNIHLFIDDSENIWKLGQSMTIKILDPIDFDVFGLAIFTDRLNRLNLSGSYSKLVGIVSNIPSNIPEIEIICVDAINLNFIVTAK